MAKLPLIVIVGPTASGKTELAVTIATRFGGEIICADSRTIYRGMDIGTAKPSLEQQKLVPHWGIDLVDPDQRFTASDFKQYAARKIADIRQRNHIPVLVGGTGLYVDAVIFDYQFSNDFDPDLRHQLEQFSLEELLEYCHQNHIPLPENKLNRRYVIRTIERGTVDGERRLAPIEDTILVGIMTDKSLLRQRMHQRTEQLFLDGVVEETKILGKKYGWNGESMTGNVYRVLHEYIDKKISLDDAKSLLTTRDWQLAKRQLTWFKRNHFIHWFSLDQAESYIVRQLEK